MTDIVENLLPCPFCGNNNISAMDHLNWVCCESCGVQIEDGEPSSRAAWNARTPAQVAPEALKHAFTAGYWLWFGPANKRELDDGLAEIEKGWLEYDAAISLSSAERPEDHDPRCDCGHLFEICPQADCTAIKPLSLPQQDRQEAKP